MEVRILTRVRRLLQAVRYDLRPDIPSVPCDAEGNPRVKSFDVGLYKTVGDNMPLLHRTTKLRYRRKESSGRWTAWVDKQDSDTITVPTGLYVQYEIEAYYGGALLTSLGVSTTLDGGMGSKGAQPRTRVWSPDASYMQGQGTEEWYDISLYREDKSKPYERYLCLISHGPRNITPKEDVAQKLGYWALAADFEFIATRLLLAERINANLIDTESLVVEMLRTRPIPNPNGREVDNSHIEIQGTEINIFGKVARNIQFGVNEEGMAVMKYFDNQGRLLYDLGPDGITKIPISEEKWTEVWIRNLGTDLSKIFMQKSYKEHEWRYNINNRKYKYHSKKVGPTLEDPENDGKVFEYEDKSKQYTLTDGWYINAPSTPNQKYLPNIQGIPVEDNNRFTIEGMHPENEYVFNRNPIYRAVLNKYENGRVVDTQIAYWNGPRDGIIT